MSRQTLVRVAIVAAAAALRLSGIGWDGWRHQHPDERFLVMVAERLGIPASPAQALDPLTSPANPNNAGFDFFVYGALPPQMTAALGALLGVGDYGGLLVVGRCLAVAVDLLALWMVMVLARRLAGGRAELIAGALYASCAAFIQQSRFATCDVWGVAAVLAVACAVVTSRRPRPSRLVAAGVALGAAVACRPNLLLAAVIPAAAVLAAAAGRARSEEDAVGRGGATAWGAIGWALGALATVAGASLITLKLADPGAFSSVWSVLPSPRRLASLQQLAAIARGAWQYPPNLQWADRRPVLDALVNVLVWGTGPALGVLLPVALGARVRRALLGERAWLPLLVWVVPFAAWHLVQLVCPVRYLLPVLPFALVATAAWLGERRRRLALGVVVLTAAWGLAWAAIAWRGYTRVEATRWLGEHLEPGAVVTSEYWDDPLPLPGLGADALTIVETRPFDPDSPEKREVLLDALERADAVVLASQRAVGSICRVPDAYPLTSEYYHLLFSGALGFHQAATFQRRVGLGRLSLSTLGADESLSVYDHPPVWVFRKTPAYSPALTRALLERVDLEPAKLPWQTRDLQARGTPPYALRRDAGGPLPGGWRTGAAEQAGRVLLWIGVLELAGLAGRRLLLALGASLPDGGWGVSRWLGLAAAGIVWLWLGWAGIPGWNRWIPVAAVLLAAPWGVVELRRSWRESGYRVAASVFWGVFALFLALRAFNPEIYWGEKPMDAAILGGLMRAGALPPADPWMAGEPLHYYFFGFLPFAAAGRAVGASLGMTFNLAAASVPALAAGCAASLGWLLSGRRTGAVLAAALAQLVGTLAVAFVPGLLAAPEFNRFWASSRVIGTTINEYPVWTALFADLHAHFLGFPGFLAFVLVASAVALRRVRMRFGALLAGAVLAAELMTNTWELPALAILAVGAALVAPSAGARRRRLVTASGLVASLGFAALLLSFPYWSSVSAVGSGVSLNRLGPPPLGAFAQLFGIPLLLALVCLAATAWGRKHGREVAWSWWLVGLGAALVLAPELVTISDRMNTVFKLHLQAHLLLGAALGGLLAAVLPSVPGWRRAALAAVAAVAVAAGMATSVSCARAVLATRRVAGPRPTLDGVAYLDTSAPDQAEVLRMLAATDVAGTAIEPPGEPYSDSMRAPMFTGRSALVGWEYHLWQRYHSPAAVALRRDDLRELRHRVDLDLLAALVQRHDIAAACEWMAPPATVAGLPGWRTEIAGDAGASLALGSGKAP